MRKYINITTAIAIVMLLTVTSCKKSFLEVVPKGELIATTYNDYNLLMNSSDFYLFVGNTGIWQPAMLMGDEVSAEESYFNSSDTKNASRILFEWQDTPFPLSSDSQIQNPQFISNSLRIFYVANKIINEVPGAAGGTAQQKLELQSEAMAERAYMYFQIINYFGKPYAAATASNDPGFPIITATDVAANSFTRSSVQAVYDFIIKDLTTAIPNLNIQQPVATRISKAAAEGILGKVYLTMGKTAEALTMFNAAFNDIGKMSFPPKLYDYNVTFAPDGSFLPVNEVSGPNSPFNNETDMTESVVARFAPSGSNDDDSGNGFGNDFLTITPKTVALYDPADFRLNFYTNIQQDQQTPIAGGRLRKNGVKYSRVGLELSDLYLLRAEAEARTNDLPGAKNDVEILRQNRMPVAKSTVPPATATDQNALLKFILDERIREFAQTGYRWWDMRRLSVDPLFSGQPAAVHTLYLNAGGTTQYTLKPERFTLRFPTYYINKNPGMVNNP